MRSLALVIFGITYLLLAIGRVRPFRLDRTGIAIVGAAAMVLTGVVPLPRAAEAVDYRTLMLLFGMMIIVANLRLSGFFRLVTARVARLAHSPVQLLINGLDNSEHAWLMVAAVSTQAGNLTPLGSIANLIVIEQARRAGVEVSFWNLGSPGRTYHRAHAGNGDRVAQPQLLTSRLKFTIHNIHNSPFTIQGTPTPLDPNPIRPLDSRRGFEPARQREGDSQ